MILHQPKFEGSIFTFDIDVARLTEGKKYVLKAQQSQTYFGENTVLASTPFTAHFCYKTSITLNLNWHFEELVVPGSANMAYFINPLSAFTIVPSFCVLKSTSAYIDPDSLAYVKYFNRTLPSVLDGAIWYTKNAQR